MKHNSILITGSAGFVGSNLAVSFKKKYPKIRIIAMDNLKRRGSELNLSRLKEAGVEFIHGDIRSHEDFPQIDYDAMVECSAEPSVLSGYDGNPLYVINTNLTGTINCLEEARKRKADIIFLSTSRVYPYEKINKIEIIEDKTRFIWKDGQDIRGWSTKGISEDFPLEGPRSLYGASKLCSELLLQEYISMYGLKAVINRFGVIAGPWQFGKVDQGVFTLWMLAHYFKKGNLKYIGFGGEGKQVRDLLHMEDVFNLIDMELKNINKVNGRIYNVGGSKDISLSLLETTAICQEITGNKIAIGRESATRPADMAIYIGDNNRVTSETGWSPKHSAKNILEDIYRWIKGNESSISKSLL
jgi:CDP-paratose 2-epimerase